MANNTFKKNKCKQTQHDIQHRKQCYSKKHLNTQFTTLQFKQKIIVIHAILVENIQIGRQETPSVDSIRNCIDMSQR